MSRTLHTKWSTVCRSALVISACVGGAAIPADAQTVDLRLGLTYADPSDSQSGGTFEVAALSSGGAGIAGIVTRLVGIDFNLPTSPIIETPATYNWLETIITSEGPVVPILDRGNGITEILLGQDVSVQSSLVYGIGGGVGTPGDQGADPFAAGFDNAALLLTGVFLPGQSPDFSSVAGLQSAANTFLSSIAPDATSATVTTSVVDNLIGGIAGDYDGNGSVGPEDYAVWVADYGSTTSLDADGNGDLVVDAADYTVWRDNLPPSATAVPEPASICVGLLAVALIANRRAAGR